MKIRKILSIILVATVILTCSGCSLNFFSVESLLSPPKQPGKNGEVQKAFYDVMNSLTLQLKTPSYGEYQTSIILKDLDNDAVDEAVVFYSDTSSIEGSVRLALMEYKNKKWSVSADVKGAGNGVYDISFVDLNSDGIKEVFVNWSLIDAKTAKIVSVYEFTKEEKTDTLKALANEYSNAQTFLDFDGDGNDDLILVYLDDTGTIQKSFLRMFSLNDSGQLIKYGEVALDSAISSVSSINCDIVNNNSEKYSRLFVDCLKNDRMIFTELVYWDNALSTPVKAFKTPSVTNLRSVGIHCFDIDNDGLLEVPTVSKLFGDETNFTVSRSSNNNHTLSLVKWHHVKGDNRKGSFVTLYNSMDNYLFSFPWGNKVTVYYDSLRDALLFCQWDEETKTRGDELFSVSYRAQKTENEIIGATLYETETGVYYYKITQQGKSFGITDKKVISSFIKMN